jgi:N-sulfoglucosamine sulfohydrolase
MKRIFFFAILLIISGTLVSFGITKQFTKGEDNAAHKMPNIVIFVADDLGVDDIEPYGNKIVSTPNLDHLAGQSLRFTNAFANTPTCIPSRSVLYTGLMPIKNGSHANNVRNMNVGECKPDIKSIPHYLKSVGYRVAQAGKRHFFPLSVFPFEFLANSELPEPGHEKNSDLWMDLNTKVVDQWLGQQKSEQPFCLVVCDNSPHVYWPEKPEYKKDHMDVKAKHIGTEEYKYERSRYYTDVTKMDNNVGMVLNSLAKYGLDDNTIFIFTSDQGPQFPFAKWNLYDAGVHVPLLIKWPGKVRPGTSKALVAHVDLLPTILQITGAQIPSYLDGKTYLDVLTKNAKKHNEHVFLTHSQDGNMNVSPMRGVRTSQYKYILNLAPQYPFTTHIDKAKKHDGGYSYFRSWEKLAETDVKAQQLLNSYHNRPNEELYDIVKDPDELHNLAGDAKYFKVLDQLRKKLSAWRQMQHDTITGPVITNEPSKF